MEPLTTVLLSIFASAGRAPLAAATARSASDGVPRRPERDTPVSVGRVTTPVPPAPREMALRACAASKPDWTTETWYCAMASPLAVRAATVVVPGATPKTNRLLALAGRTSATFGSAVKTLAAPSCKWITWPLPACSVMLARIGAMRRGVTAAIVPGCSGSCAPACASAVSSWARASGAMATGTRADAASRTAAWRSGRDVREIAIRSGIPCPRGLNRRASSGQPGARTGGACCRWRWRRPASR